MFSRRKILSTTALGAALALTLGGSTCSLGNQSASQIASDVETIAAGLAGLATAAASFVPPDILAKVKIEVAAIQGAASAIGSAVAGINVNSLLQSISSGISVLASLLGPFFPQAPVIAGVLQAALALIAFVLQAAGLQPQPAPTPAPAGMRGAAALISPDEARRILQQAAQYGVR